MVRSDRAIDDYRVHLRLRINPWRSEVQRRMTCMLSTLLPSVPNSTEEVVRSPSNTWKELYSTLAKSHAT